eukprot:SAG31_NODE_3158_length_4610_cov_2.329417_1_plen_140_part_00
MRCRLCAHFVYHRTGGTMFNCDKQLPTLNSTLFIRTGGTMCSLCLSQVLMPPMCSAELLVPPARQALLPSGQLSANVSSENGVEGSSLWLTQTVGICKGPAGFCQPLEVALGGRQQQCLALAAAVPRATLAAISPRLAF